jgi:hypothetical protein
MLDEFYKKEARENVFEIGKYEPNQTKPITARVNQ